MACRNSGCGPLDSRVLGFVKESDGGQKHPVKPTTGKRVLVAVTFHQACPACRAGASAPELRELLLIQWSSLDTNGPPVLSGVLVTVELRTLADYQGSSLRAFCQAGEGYWESNLVEWGLCPG